MRPRRILLKLSGELLGPPERGGVEATRVNRLAHCLVDALAVAEGSGHETRVGVVLGGGNFLRGAELAEEGVDRVTADGVGMLATVMNGLVLADCLERAGRPARVLSAIAAGDLVGRFRPAAAIRDLEAGRIVILVGGTGHPFFTTDTTAALRALQIRADLLAKGTRVRGVFSDDPEKNPDAEFFEHLRYSEALARGLKVMDAAAFSLCRDQGLPIRVFDMRDQENIRKILLGEAVGTLVDGGGAGSGRDCEERSGSSVRARD